MSDNPYDRLQEAADRILLEQRAAERLAAQRVRFLMSREPRGQFFASLALGLALEVDWTCETGATDGKRIAYNPKFVDGLQDGQVEGFLAHEIMHLAHAHHARRGCRDLSDWNTAADLSVNGELQEAGFTLPPGALLPGHGPYASFPLHGSAEEYYELLKQKGESQQPEKPGGQHPGQGQADGKGQDEEDQPPEDAPDPDPGKCGGVREPGSGTPAECQQAEAEAQIAVAQAEQAAKRKGQLPAGLQRLVDALVRPKVSPEEVLREFLTEKIRQESNWSRPNRRFLAQGLYLPTLCTEALGHIAFANDTSGSISRDEMQRIAGWIEDACALVPSKVTIIHHDDAVQHVQTWEPQDGELVLEPKGGGGTSHLPVFEHLAEMDEPPVCLICLTDLVSEFPPHAPDIPVLWATVGAHGRQGPFGQTLAIDD